jgi:hypothetical protein
MFRRNVLLRVSQARNQLGDLIGILFDPDDRENMFLQNVGELPPDNVTLKKGLKFYNNYDNLVCKSL